MGNHQATRGMVRGAEPALAVLLMIGFAAACQAGSGAAPAAAMAAPAALMASPSAAADSAPDAAPSLGASVRAGRMRTVVAGEQYRAGGIHRLFFGDDYRDLWTTAVNANELDLRGFAGGLTPKMRVGGKQTRGLAMKGADGRDYTFRSVDKDPTEVLAPELHGTFANRVVKDQIASHFPGGAVVVPPILEAAGVLHAEPLLVVMPDDSLLGEFRPMFAGLLGTIEEFPGPVGKGNPGFAGATEIVRGEEMWKRLDVSPAVRADARAFLTARLVDLLIGDWDRHRKQFRWAKIPGQERWQPIPEDRDQAFVRFEGLIPMTGRKRLPQFVKFGESYPGIEGLTWNGRDGDRRILVELEKPVWDRVAGELRTRITDGVIADAVSRLPTAYREREGARLEAALRHRRDNLPKVADRFYRFLARDVDIYATDQPEIVDINRIENGGVEVRISLRSAEGGTAPAPYFRRAFHPEETGEVRLYLGGGADSVITHGRAGRITVRVMGGEGDDSVDDSLGGGTHFCDPSGGDRLRPGPGTKADTRRYTPPPRTDAWVAPRDWGRRSLFNPWIGGSRDLGVMLGLGLQSEGYGFRKHPYGDRQVGRIGYATSVGALRAEYEGEFRHENSRVRTRLHARASGIDIVRFYGFGNETRAPGAEKYFKVNRAEYALEPSLLLPLGRMGTLALGPTAKFATTNLKSGRFITTVRPYGVEDFFQIGGRAGLRFDTRDTAAAAARGFLVSVEGAIFPAAGDVKSAFGEAHGEAALYGRAGRVVLEPTLALRAGGKKVWGTYPYHEAAYLGGSGTLRGFPLQRFAGDAALFGNAELRLRLTRFSLLVPGTMGVFALGDAGRVFLRGESSDRWHVAGGGGIWLAFLHPANTVSLAVATSAEKTGVYVHSGFEF